MWYNINRSDALASAFIRINNTQGQSLYSASSKTLGAFVW